MATASYRCVQEGRVERNTLHWGVFAPCPQTLHAIPQNYVENAAPCIQLDPTRLQRTAQPLRPNIVLTESVQKTARNGFANMKNPETPRSPIFLHIFVTLSETLLDIKLTDVDSFVILWSNMTAQGLSLPGSSSGHKRQPAQIAPKLCVLSCIVLLQKIDKPDQLKPVLWQCWALSLHRFWSTVRSCSRPTNLLLLL